MVDEPKFLLPREVAQRLRVSKTAVYDAIARGDLPAVHVGRAVRVEQQALFEYIRTGGKALPGGWRREGRPSALVRQSSRAKP